MGLCLRSEEILKYDYYGTAQVKFNFVAVAGTMDKFSTLSIIGIYPEKNHQLNKHIKLHMCVQCRYSGIFYSDLAAVYLS